MKYAIYNNYGGILVNDNCEKIIFENERDAIDYICNQHLNDYLWHTDTYEEEWL